MNMDIKKQIADTEYQLNELLREQNEIEKVIVAIKEYLAYLRSKDNGSFEIKTDDAKMPNVSTKEKMQKAQQARQQKERKKRYEIIMKFLQNKNVASTKEIAQHLNLGRSATLRTLRSSDNFVETRIGIWKNKNSR